MKYLIFLLSFRKAYLMFSDIIFLQNILTCLSAFHLYRKKLIQISKHKLICLIIHYVKIHLTKHSSFSYDLFNCSTDERLSHSLFSLYHLRDNKALKYFTMNNNSVSILLNTIDLNYFLYFCFAMLYFFRRFFNKSQIRW